MQSGTYSSAPDGYITSIGLGKGMKVEPVPEAPPEFTNPIRIFEMTDREMGTLYNWNNLPLEERVKQVKRLIEIPTEGGGLNIDKHRRWRTLNFVFQEESRNPEGSRDIAIVVLNALFPKGK